MEPLLQLANVSVHYGNRAAVRGVHITLTGGETTGILGRSGSGKSSLALAILRALPREALLSGVIKRNGVIAPIFQEPCGALHPLITAGDQVREAARARCRLSSRKLKAAAEAALEQSGLNAREVFDAWPHELSGGQRQRVLIAQAIIGRPDLIIADEPTASLDSITRAGILHLLKDLKTTLRMSLVFITHSPELLTGFADRVLLMDEGTLRPLGNA